jgi:hypothetical protein
MPLRFLESWVLRTSFQPTRRAGTESLIEGCLMSYSTKHKTHVSGQAPFSKGKLQAADYGSRSMREPA